MSSGGFGRHYHGGGSKSDAVASLAALQAGRTTQWVWDMGAAYDTPLVPFVQYRETKEDDFMTCMMRGLNVCNRSFSGEGQRACIYGMLLASDLMPSGVGAGVVEADGPYATGLGLACSRTTLDLIPRRE